MNREDMIKVERWTRLSIASTALGAAFVVVLAFGPFFLSANSIDKLTTLFIYVILAATWNALAGYGGLVSVGQQAFFGLGAYAAVRLANLGLNPFLLVLRWRDLGRCRFAADIDIHVASESQRICHRHVGDRRTRSPACEARRSDQRRNRNLVHRAQPV